MCEVEINSKIILTITPEWKLCCRVTICIVFILFAISCAHKIEIDPKLSKEIPITEYVSSSEPLESHYEANREFESAFSIRMYPEFLSFIKERMEIAKYIVVRPARLNRSVGHVKYFIKKLEDQAIGWYPSEYAAQMPYLGGKSSLFLTFNIDFNDDQFTFIQWEQYINDLVQSDDFFQISIREDKNMDAVWTSLAEEWSLIILRGFLQPKCMKLFLAATIISEELAPRKAEPKLFCPAMQLYKELINKCDGWMTDEVAIRKNHLTKKINFIENTEGPLCY